MKYLLDTHTWVWWNMRPQNLSRKVTKLIENEAEYDELLYVQSLW
jgi:PIN domain nuclease of toxin-antitoxin system